VSSRRIVEINAPSGVLNSLQIYGVADKFVKDDYTVETIHVRSVAGA